MAGTEEMAPIDHFREEIDHVNILTAMLEIRMQTRIIGIIMMKIRITRTITGVFRKGWFY